MMIHARVLSAILFVAAGNALAQEPPSLGQPKSNLFEKFMGSALCAPNSPFAKGLIPQDELTGPALCSCTLEKLQARAPVRDRLEKLFASDAERTPPSEADASYAVFKVLSGLLSCKADAFEVQAERGLIFMDKTALVSILGKPSSEAGAAPKNRTRPVKGTGANCQPVMPPLAEATHASGVTKLVFFVNEKGKVTKFEVAKSSGETVVHKLLDFQAIASLAGCTFTPSMDDGTPRGTWVEQEFQWNNPVR